MELKRASDNLILLRLTGLKTFLTKPPLRGDLSRREKSLWIAQKNAWIFPMLQSFQSSNPKPGKSPYPPGNDHISHSKVAVGKMIFRLFHGICSNSQVGVPQNLNLQKGIVFSHKKSKCWVLKVGSFKVKGSLLKGFIQTSGVPKLAEKNDSMKSGSTGGWWAP